MAKAVQSGDTDVEHVIIVSHSPIDTHGRLLRFVRSLLKAGYSVSVIGTEPATQLSVLKNDNLPVSFRPLKSQHKGFVGRMSRVLRNTIGMLPGNSGLNLSEIFLPRLKKDMPSGTKTIAVLAMHVLSVPLAHRLAQANGARLIYDITEAASEQYDYSALWKTLERPFIRKLEAWALKIVDATITSSPGFAEVSLANLRSQKDAATNHCPDIRYLPNYSGEEIAPRPKEQNEALFLYQGLATTDRHLTQMIKSIVLWPEQAKLILQLAGSIHDRENIRQMIIEEGLEKRITFLDPVPANQLAKAALESNAIAGFCLLDRRYTQSRTALTNKMFSYIAAGVIPITNFGTFTAEFVEKNSIGPIVEMPEPMEIASTVTALIEQPEQRKTYQQKLAQRAQEFRWEIIEYEFLNIIASGAKT